MAVEAAIRKLAQGEGIANMQELESLGLVATMLPALRNGPRLRSDLLSGLCVSYVGISLLWVFGAQ